MLHEATGWADNLQFTLPDVDGFRYSDSGDRLVTWQQRGLTTVWDAHTGQELYHLDPDVEVEVGWAVFTAGSEDRRLEVFGIGTDDGVWHTWQSSPGGAWN